MELRQETAAISPPKVETDPRPDLRVLPGGVAVEQAVELTPSLAEISFDEFKAMAHGLIEGEESMTPDQRLEMMGRMLALHTDLFETQRDINRQIGELMQKSNEITSWLHHLRGYMKDRPDLLPRDLL
jgi:hypothetical protein